MTTRDVIIAVGFLVVGWCGHIGWQQFTDWLYEATGVATDAVRDVLAVVGIATVCYLGYLAFT